MNIQIVTTDHETLCHDQLHHDTVLLEPKHKDKDPKMLVAEEDPRVCSNPSSKDMLLLPNNIEKKEHDKTIQLEAANSSNKNASLISSKKGDSCVNADKLISDILRESKTSNHHPKKQEQEHKYGLSSMEKVKLRGLGRSRSMDSFVRKLEYETRQLRGTMNKGDGDDSDTTAATEVDVIDTCGNDDNEVSKEELLDKIKELVMQISLQSAYYTQEIEIKNRIIEQRTAERDDVRSLGGNNNRNDHNDQISESKNGSGDNSNDNAKGVSRINTNKIVAETHVSPTTPTSESPSSSSPSPTPTAEIESIDAWSFHGRWEDAKCGSTDVSKEEVDEKTLEERLKVAEANVALLQANEIRVERMLDQSYARISFLEQELQDCRARATHAESRLKSRNDGNSMSVGKSRSVMDQLAGLLRSSEMENEKLVSEIEVLEQGLNKVKDVAIHLEKERDVDRMVIQELEQCLESRNSTESETLLTKKSMECIELIKECEELKAQLLAKTKILEDGTKECYNPIKATSSATSARGEDLKPSDVESTGFESPSNSETETLLIEKSLECADLMTERDDLKRELMVAKKLLDDSKSSWDELENIFKLHDLECSDLRSERDSLRKELEDLKASMSKAAT